MRKPLASLLIALLCFLVADTWPRFELPKSTQSDAKAAYAQLPLAFEPNVGQAPSGVQFVTHQGQATTYVTNTGTTTVADGESITMSLVDAQAASFAGTGALTGTTNYLVGNDHAKWQHDIASFGKIVAQNVYPGIDMAYYGTNSHLEHDFIVGPGGDYHAIGLTFTGQGSPSTDAQGNLVFGTPEHGFMLQAPSTYQETASGRRAISSSFAVDGETVRIALAGDYDHTKPLVIDPLFLVYSSHLGGSGTDSGYAVTVDRNGNAYVVGQTTSSNFPVSSPYQGSMATSADGFITKFDPTGAAFVYSTYLGGDGANDQINSIVVDATGNAYVTGQTDSTDFPTQDPYQATLTGSLNAFVSKLNPTGSTLLYSTYLGGSGGEDGRSIEVDATGAIYVAGSTVSTDFPTEAAFQSTLSGAHDVFVTKFTPDGSALAFSTYLGGSGEDGTFVPGMGVDSSGNVYVAGRTASSDFPTQSPYQGSYAGGATDLFVSKLAADGSSLVYSTYIGGSGTDGVGGDIRIDSAGDAYVTADTTSTNYPTQSPQQATYGGGATDAVVTELNAAGSGLVYSTYLGGSGADAANGIAVDSAGYTYVIGTTDSTNFPVQSYWWGTNSGGTDIFLTKYTPGGSFEYSSYYGTADTETGLAVAAGLSGDAYITGQTNTTTPSIFFSFLGAQGSAGGGTDAYLVKLTENGTVVNGLMQPLLSFSVSPTTCDMGAFSVTQTKSCTHQLAASSNAVGGYVVSYRPTTTLTSGSYTISALTSQTGSTVGTEQFGMNLAANTAAGSNTAADFGADPTGGTGTALAGYQTANQFKFAVGGADIAETTGPSDITTFTASYIANIAVETEAGTYTTPVTYTIVPAY